MKKNLVIGVVGNHSLHKRWTDRRIKNFDLCLVYYGNHRNRYAWEADYYFRYQGTKFNIVHQLLQEHPDLFEKYQNFLFPDDDLYLTPVSIEKFFNTFDEFQLEIAQPSIQGYLSVPISAHIPFNRLRFTNWVEIMCPCFAANALKLCADTFLENKTNWGIEFLWNKLLGEPIDKIAIIDEAVAVHTRPCFQGDAYSNNKNTCQFAFQEYFGLIEKHGVSEEKIIHRTIPLNFDQFYNRPSEERLIPPLPEFAKFCQFLREDKKFI